MGQNQAGNKENRSQNTRATAQKVRRTRGAKNTAGSTATKCRTHVRAFTVLHEHQADDGQRHQNMNSQNQGK